MPQKTTNTNPPSHEELYNLLMQRISEQKAMDALQTRETMATPKKTNSIKSLSAKLLALFARKPKNPV